MLEDSPDKTLLINTPGYKLIYLKKERAFFGCYKPPPPLPSPPLLPRFMGTSGCTYLYLDFLPLQSIQFFSCNEIKYLSRTTCFETVFNAAYRFPHLLPMPKPNPKDLNRDFTPPVTLMKTSHSIGLSRHQCQTSRFVLKESHGWKRVKIGLDGYFIHRFTLLHLKKTGKT